MRRLYPDAYGRDYVARRDDYLTSAPVTEATTNNRDQLDPELLARLRAHYDRAVSWGITTNRHRDWHKGNHPGYTLAKRLHDKADAPIWSAPATTAFTPINIISSTSRKLRGNR